MSTPTKPALMPTRTEPAKPFNEMFGKFLTANLNHMSKHDFLNLPDCRVLHSIQDPVSSGLWLLVPDDDNSIHQQLIELGYQYAFVSLLQVAARNSCQWIRMSEDAPVISGVHLFEGTDAAWVNTYSGGVLQ